MAKTTELELAYMATSYRIFLPGGKIDLRIGQHSAALCSWMKTQGASTFAIITAYNPHSLATGIEENAECQARLECELLEGNYEPYAGENVPDVAAVPSEESCFVADIALEDACALGADFGQNAIVFGCADAVPKLIWIDIEE